MRTKLGSTLILLGMISSVHAATATGTVTATIVNPVTVTETQQMNFGSFAVGATGGSLTVDEAGAISFGPDIDIITGSGVAAGRFAVTGEANTAIAISLSGAAVLSDGTNTISMVPALQVTPPADTGISGTVELLVGGTLTVGGNQPAGTYNTSNAGGAPYAVTVNYN